MPKGMPGNELRFLRDCRDNKGKLAKCVFTCWRVTGINQKNILQ